MHLIVFIRGWSAQFLFVVFRDFAEALEKASELKLFDQKTDSCYLYCNNLQLMRNNNRMEKMNNIRQFLPHIMGTPCV